MKAKGKNKASEKYSQIVCKDCDGTIYPVTDEKEDIVLVCENCKRPYLLPFKIGMDRETMKIIKEVK